MRHVRVAGEDGVLAGIKSPGTPIPLTIGFDPNTRTVRWTTTLASIAPGMADSRYRITDRLAGGRYVAAHDIGGEMRLTALDAKTGARLWDTRLEGNPYPRYLLVQPRFIYVVHDSIDVYDAATGKVLGTIPP